MVFLAFLLVGAFVFGLGFMLGQSFFKTDSNRIMGGILFGLGTVALVAAVMFVGCLSMMKF